VSGVFTRRGRAAQVPDQDHAARSVLNAFEIINPQALRWSAARYHVQPQDGDLTHEKSGAAKRLIWDLKKAQPSDAPGRGFVLLESPNTVLVPRAWCWADQEFQGFSVRRGANVTLRAEEPQHQRLVRELLGTALRTHLKNAGTQLGQLWAHHLGLCELPKPHPEDPDVQFARRFEVTPMTLRGHRWVMQVHISTVSVDGFTVAQYAQQGDCAALAERVVLKRVNRQTRALEPTAVNVLVQRGGRAPQVMELLQPEQFADRARLSAEQQRTLADQPIQCRPYMAEEVSVEPADVRLILDTQITRSVHRETILSVEARTDWLRRVRMAADGFDAFGVSVKLAETLFEVPGEQTRTVALPPLLVKAAAGTRTIPGASGEDDIRQRAHERTRALAEQGYLHSRPLVPVLAVQSTYGAGRARQLCGHLTQLAQERHLDFEFSVVTYSCAQDIQHACEKEGYNAVIAVLPEGRAQPQQDGDTHDQIKRSLKVPSQCIRHDNTHHRRDVPLEDLPRAVRGRYRLLLEQLAVKAGFIPYTTASPSAFNVHIGIDVGGIRNNYAMACMAHGLAAPAAQPIYLPLPIHVDSPQVEPIPDGALCESLDADLRRVRAKVPNPDFERVLFIRDGDLNGQGPVWQEIDGLRALHARWVADGLISGEAVWAVAEVSKRAEHWRQLRQQGADVLNPLVGTVTFPFDNPNQALISTTGAPYLPQGTADPLFVTVTALAGHVEPWAVMQDLVWGADLSFSKTDLGTSLPWVLHVADRAALAVAEGQPPRTGVLI